MILLEIIGIYIGWALLAGLILGIFGTLGFWIGTRIGDSKEKKQYGIKIPKMSKHQQREEERKHQEEARKHQEEERRRQQLIEEGRIRFLKAQNRQKELKELEKKNPEFFKMVEKKHKEEEKKLKEEEIKYQEKERERQEQIKEKERKWQEQVKEGEKKRQEGLKEEERKRQAELDKHLDLISNMSEEEFGESELCEKKDSFLETLEKKLITNLGEYDVDEDDSIKRQVGKIYNQGVIEKSTYDIIIEFVNFKISYDNEYRKSNYLNESSKKMSKRNFFVR